LFSGGGIIVAIIVAQATGTGRVVRWSALKEGRLEDATRLGTLFFTTTLPDVITCLLAAAEAADPKYRLVTVIPNGPTRASLDLAILGSGFEVLCSRRLVRGLFPVNPFAAEFGANYDVVVSINAPVELEAQWINELQANYPCRVVTK
jgi:hypothetical protein